MPLETRTKGMPWYGILLIGDPAVCAEIAEAHLCDICRSEALLAV